MELSIFIAKALGLIYLVIGLGTLFNEKYYRNLIDDMAKNDGVIYIGGVIALITGLAIVSYHNRWDGNWTIIITLLGWLALAEGIMTLLIPDIMAKCSYKMMKKSNFGLLQIFTLIIGLVFCYFGFMS